MTEQKEGARVLTPMERGNLIRALACVGASLVVVAAQAQPVMQGVKVVGPVFGQTNHSVIAVAPGPEGTFLLGGNLIANDRRGIVGVFRPNGTPGAFRVLGEPGMGVEVVGLLPYMEQSNIIAILIGLIVRGENGVPRAGVMRLNPDLSTAWLRWTPGNVPESMTGFNVDRNGGITIVGTVGETSGYVRRFNMNGERPWGVSVPAGGGAPGPVWSNERGVFVQFQLNAESTNVRRFSGANGATIWSSPRLNDGGIVVKRGEQHRRQSLAASGTEAVVNTQRGTGNTAQRRSDFVRLNLETGAIASRTTFNSPFGSENGFLMGVVPSTGGEFVAWGSRNAENMGEATWLRRFKPDGALKWNRYYKPNDSTVFQPGAGLAAPDGNVVTMALCNNEVVQALYTRADGALFGNFGWDPPVVASTMTQALQEPSGDILQSCYSFGAANPTNTIVLLRQRAVAFNDVYSVPRNVPTEVASPVTRNDRYWMGGAVRVTQQPTQGTVTLLPGGRFRYTPPQGFTGEATWKYVIDKQGLSSSEPATVTMRVGL